MKRYPLFILSLFFVLLLSSCTSNNLEKLQEKDQFYNVSITLTDDSEYSSNIDCLIEKTDITCTTTDQTDPIDIDVDSDEFAFIFAYLTIDPDELTKESDGVYTMNTKQVIEWAKDIDLYEDYYDTDEDLEADLSEENINFKLEFSQKKLDKFTIYLDTEELIVIQFIY